MFHSREAFLLRPLERPGARVLASALRASAAGFGGVSTRCFDIVFDTLCDAFGEAEGERAAGAVLALVRRLRRSGGFDAMPLGCRLVTHDELLVIALVAAHQNGDGLLVERIGLALQARGVAGVQRHAAALAATFRDAGYLIGPVAAPTDPDTTRPACGRNGGALPCMECE
jgi:hypothetical protein